jgi:CHAT domain-containing protein
MLVPADARTLAGLEGEFEAYYEHGFYEWALQASTRRLELVSRVYGERSPKYIDALLVHADSLDSLGRAWQAEPFLRHALVISLKLGGEKDYYAVKSLRAVAENLETLGRAAEAEPLLRRALALSVDSAVGEISIDAIESLLLLAENVQTLGRAAEAEPLFQRALALSTEFLGENHPFNVGIFVHVARNLEALGRAAEAEPLLRRALALATAEFGEDHGHTILILASVAQNLEALGRTAEAEPLLRRALALATANSGRAYAASAVVGEKDPSTLAVAAALALNLLRQPSRASVALDFARTAADGRRLRRRGLGASPRDEAELSRDVREEQGYFRLLANADWSAAQARPADLPLLRSEAFAALQDAMAGSANQAIAQMAARQAAERAGEGLGALARERQLLWDRWQANERARTQLLADEAADKQDKLEDLHTEQATLEGEMVRTDERLRKEAPQYYALIRPEPLELAGAQQLLAPDEAALMVVPTEFGTHVVAVSREGITWTRAELTESQVQEAVRKLREDLTTVEWEPVMSGFDRSTAHGLYRALIAPVAETIRSKRHLFIAAGGALSSLPFGVLVTTPPTGNDADPYALRSTPWFNDSHAIIQLPSLQSLQFLRSFGGRVSGGGGFTGFGDPLLQGNAVARGKTPSRGVSTASVLTGRRTRDGVAIADVSQLRRLARLPGTAVELENMRKALGAPISSVRVGETATESAVRAAHLADSQILAFATHGLVAGEVDGAAEPGLVLTPPATGSEGDDGFLTASEVTTLKLNADWVILSACNTASGDGYGEPSLSGLARAFFYAGARSLLASHWPVLDEVASRLTVDAIKRQRQDPNVSRAEALQAAMIDIRNSPDNPAFAHPAAWAPFSLVGEGAR